MPKLSLSDATLHYETSGDGPPLLLIAGFMSDGASWAPLLPILEPDFTVIRPDNRTCGQTQPWDAPANMTIWAQDLSALLDHLGHDKVHVVGHSLGGLIGWALARLAPNRIGSLTMMGSAPILTPRNIALFKALIAVRRSDAPDDTWLRLLFPWLFQRDAFFHPDAIDTAVAGSLAYPHAQSADAMEHQLNAIADTDPTLFASAPDVPSHALLSPDDLLVPIEDARASLKGIPLTEMPGLGHSLHWDDPEGVAAHIVAITSKNRL